MNNNNSINDNVFYRLLFDLVLFSRFFLFFFFFNCNSLALKMLTLDQASCLVLGYKPNDPEERKKWLNCSTHT